MLRSWVNRYQFIYSARTIKQSPFYGERVVASYINLPIRNDRVEIGVFDGLSLASDSRNCSVNAELSIGCGSVEVLYLRLNTIYLLKNEIIRAHNIFLNRRIR